MKKIALGKKFYLTGSETDIAGLDMTMTLRTLKEAENIVQLELTSRWDDRDRLPEDNYEIIFEVKPIKLFRRVATVKVESINL
jgi:hypothetical protein